MPKLPDRASCAIRAEEVLGEDRALSSKEIDELVKEINEAVGSGDLEARLEDIKKTRKFNKTKETHEAILHKAKMEEVKKFVLQEEFLRPGQANKAFESLAENSNFLVAGGRFSKENIRATNKSHLDLFLDQSLKREGVERFYDDPKLEQDNTVAAFKLVRGEDISKFSPETQKVAKIIADLDKYSLKMLERSGMIIEGRKDHLWVQDHDFAKITAEGMNKWVDFMHDELNLDRKATFGKSNRDDKSRKKFLEGVWKSIVRGDFELNNGSTKAMKRVLHFADGESLYKYNKRFGAGTMAEAINKSMDITARSSATAQKLGPFPKKTWREAELLMAEKVNELHGPAAAREFEAGPSARRRKQLLRNALGFEEAPEHNWKTKSLTVLQALNATSKLMQSAAGTLVDHSTNVANLMAKTGASFFEAQRLALVGTMKNLTKEQRRKTGKILGVWHDAELDKYGVLEGVAGKSKMWSNRIMRFSGMPYMSTVNKATGSWGIGNKFGEAADRSFKQLDPRMRAELESFSITDKEWDILRKHVVDDEGYTMIAPGEILDADIKGMSDDAKMLAAQKMTALMQHNGGRIASASTGVRTRSFTNQGISPNSAVGKGITTVFQFKAFPIEIANVLTEIATANPATKSHGFFNAMKDKDNAKIMGVLMADAFVMATFGLWARDLMNGLEPRDMTRPENALEALSRSVMPLQFSYIFDALKGDYGGWGRSITRDLLGPTGALADDLVRVISTGATGGDISPGVTKVIRSNLPLVKHPLIQPILNKWFLTEFNEMISPGYIRRQEKRMEEKGQERYIDFFNPF